MNNNEPQDIHRPQGPDDWFKSLPFVTRYWLGATAAMTLAGNFNIVPPMQIVYAWSRITTNFEVWRLLTPFLFAGSFSFPTLITVYMLYQFSKQYEGGGPYNTGAGGGTADYIFMLMFGMAVILITYPFVGIVIPLGPVFCRTLVFFVLYTWSKRNPDAQSNIWGVPVPGIYLPFAYICLTVFMGNPYGDLLHGVAVGHVYYFLVDVVPQVQGRDVLVTPQILIDQFGVGEYRPQQVPMPRENARFGAASAGRATQPSGAGGGGHQWGGSGQRLGRG